MEPESHVVSTSPQPISTTPAPGPQVPDRQLIAPVWHTILLIALFLGNSYFSATHMPTTHDGAPSERILILQYAVTIGFELFLLALVWVGLRLKKVKMRELIGGRWKAPEDFLLDVAIAVGFWIVSVAVIFGLAHALGLANPSQIKESKKLLDMLGPQSGMSMVLFVVVSCAAGLVEEILFRGYLQRQIGALTGNVYLGLIGSAILFGAGHGYEGARRMVLIAVLGAMFGLLALLRKSLRPGMMAHALFDSAAGAGMWLARKGAIPNI